MQNSKERQKCDRGARKREEDYIHWFTLPMAVAVRSDQAETRSQEFHHGLVLGCRGPSTLAIFRLLAGN